MPFVISIENIPLLLDLNKKCNFICKKMILILCALVQSVLKLLLSLLPLQRSQTLIFFNGENDMLDSLIPCLIFQLQRTFALEKGVML